MVGGTASVGAHRPETVGIVHEEGEIEILLHRHDFVQLAEVALHAEHTLRNDENAAAGLLHQFRRPSELHAEPLHVVVRIDETFAHVHAQSVDDAGMRLGIVNYGVAARQQAVDNGYHPLIAEVEQERILLAHEFRQTALQFLMVFGLPAHHACAHGSGHAELHGADGVGLAYLRMVGQSEVVVEAPVEDLLAAELHAGPYVALQLGECEIAVCIIDILPNRAAGIIPDSL